MIYRESTDLVVEACRSAQVRCAGLVSVWTLLVCSLVPRPHLLHPPLGTKNKTEEFF